MSRLTNQCEYAHTPQTPQKALVRGNMLRRCDPTKDVIAVSHALGDSLVTVGWAGRIFMCDIDQGVRNQIEYSRKDYLGTLDIQAPGHSIESTTENYCLRNRPGKLTLVDNDLTGCVQTCWKVQKPVLNTLLAHGHKDVLVALTFRNGRTCPLGSFKHRVEWLRSQLPPKVVIEESMSYTSLRVGPRVERTPHKEGLGGGSKGSAMGIVMMRLV